MEKSLNITPALREQLEDQKFLSQFINHISQLETDQESFNQIKRLLTSFESALLNQKWKFSAHSPELIETKMVGKPVIIKPGYFQIADNHYIPFANLALVIVGNKILIYGSGGYNPIKGNFGKVDARGFDTYGRGQDFIPAKNRTLITISTALANPTNFINLVIENFFKPSARLVSKDFHPADIDRRVNRIITAIVEQYRIEGITLNQELLLPVQDVSTQKTVDKKLYPKPPII